MRQIFGVLLALLLFFSIENPIEAKTKKALISGIMSSALTAVITGSVMNYFQYYEDDYGHNQKRYGSGRIFAFSIGTGLLVGGLVYLASSNRNKEFHFVKVWRQRQDRPSLSIRPTFRMTRSIRRSQSSKFAVSVSEVGAGGDRSTMGL